MRNRLMGIFAALAMLLTGFGASVAPTEASAQSYRYDRGYSRNSGFNRGRYYAPRRGFRGYRGGGYRTYRGYRGYRGGYRGYRGAYRGRGYRGYRGYRNYRGYRGPRGYYGRRYRY